jgi:hypothetical protein
MRVIMLFQPDPEEPDPARGHPEGGQHYEFLPEGDDIVVVWREWGEQFQDGKRTHIWGQGVWENLTDEQADWLIGAIDDTLRDADENEGRVIGDD